MLYDIPHRSGIPIETDTLMRLAEHDRIVAVKDAKGDLAAGSEVIATTGLAYYSGDDPLTLPWLSVGAVGVVSMSAHLAAPRIRAMIAAFLTGDVAEAARLHRELLPVHAGARSARGDLPQGGNEHAGTARRPGAAAPGRGDRGAAGPAQDISRPRRREDLARSGPEVRGTQRKTA